MPAASPAREGNYFTLHLSPFTLFVLKREYLPRVQDVERIERLLDLPHHAHRLAVLGDEEFHACPARCHARRCRCRPSPARA